VTPTLLGPLERANLDYWSSAKGPNKLGVSLSSPEEGNRSSFRNIVFSRSLQFRTMRKFHILADSERYTHHQNALNSTYFANVSYFLSAILRLY
jgi:hypothetical protein